MKNIKNLTHKFINVFTVKQWSVIISVILGLNIFAGTFLIYLAYRYGATCFDDSGYEGYYTFAWIISTIFCNLFPYGSIALCILFIILRKWVLAMRFFLIISIFLVGLYAFAYMIEPLAFYSLKGFVTEVPQKVDIEGVQNWLDKAELKQSYNDFEDVEYESLPKEITELNPKFVTVYNFENKRAVRLSYGNSAISMLFGVIITGKDVVWTDIDNVRQTYWTVNDINEHCYVWTGRKVDKPVAASMLGVAAE